MNSMTGYGKGEAKTKCRTITIELKSVNNRYLEINSRLPKSLSFCDEIIRKKISEVIKRGSVDVFFNYENTSEDAKTIQIDMGLAREYCNAAKKLRTEFCLDDDFNVTALLRSPDVMKVEFTKDDPEIIKELVEECIVEAVNALDSMRKTEGIGIHKNLSELITNIIESLKHVMRRAPIVVAEYRQKLETRIKDVLQGVEIDEARLLNETAYFVDKADISEEISRLSSHLNQFISTLELDEPQGRKLDFIAQEMNREINTMGSKSNDTELTNIVVYMKNELEKIKEQIRNIE